MLCRVIPALLALLAPLHALADSLRLPPLGPGQLCRNAIEAAERAHGIPAHLLAAIAHVESGRRNAATGQIDPWPWTINKDGAGSFYDVKSQAVAAAEAMRPRVARSIDVGCMQISLTMHPDAFTSMDQAFDPAANADYGARFLVQLFEKTGSWPKAVGMYHSATPELGADYQAKVYAVLPQEQRLANVAMPLPAVAGGLNRTPFPSMMAQPPARIIPLSASSASSGFTGKSLEAYRLTAVRMAYAPR